MATIPIALFVYLALDRDELSVCTCFRGYNRTFVVSSAGVVVLSVLLALVTVIVAIQYLGFYYLIIDRTGIRQSKYFGLVEHQIPLGSVVEVATRPLGRFTGRLGIPAIAFCSPNDVIEISTTWYWNGEMRDALRFMRDIADVRVDPELLRHLRVN